MPHQVIGLMTSWCLQALVRRGGDPVLRNRHFRSPNDVLVEQGLREVPKLGVPGTSHPRLPPPVKVCGT
jgi:hypothetical protein